MNIIWYFVDGIDAVLPGVGIRSLRKNTYTPYQWKFGKIATKLKYYCPVGFCTALKWINVADWCMYYDFADSLTL